MDMSALTKKVGPLQVWQYALITAGAVWAYYWWSHRNAGSTSPYDELGVPNPADSGIGSIGGSGDPSNTGGGSVPGTSGAVTPTDNLSWLTMAANYLVGFNYDAVAVNNALTKYLQGAQLTVSERALVNQAIARWGVPPEGVPVTPGQPPAPPPLPVPPDDRPGTPRPGLLGVVHINSRLR